jgi:beta-phosphoglucomutase-like phosphatase (HAD superfamily)
MTLQAIVFGVDGVLAETQEARREAFNKVFAEAGLDWHWGRVLYAELLKATDGKEMIQAFVDRHRPHWRSTEDLSHLIAAMTRRHATIDQELLDKGAVKFRSGVTHFLRVAAQAGVLLAIATDENWSKVSSLLRANLEPLGTTEFNTVCTADDDAGGRANDWYARALKALALPPEGCLAVESSAKGIQSAVAAGLPTVITWGFYSQLHECAEALLAANEVAPVSTSSMILSRWDCRTPAELLVALRGFHEAQLRSPGSLRLPLPAARSRPDKELDHAGV